MYYKVKITCINTINCMRSLVGQVLLIDYRDGPTSESDIFLPLKIPKWNRLKLRTDTCI